LSGDVPFPGDNFVTVAMRHVNDPVPSVRDVRDDVSPRLDWVVQRAMAKDHQHRFGSMNELAAELEACYAELDGDEGATMIASGPATARTAPRRATRGRRRRAIWPFVLLGVALAALAGGIAGLLLFRDDDGSNGTTSPPAAAKPVRWTQASSYDPDGDGTEHESDAPDAIDGNGSTYWTTESYRDFTGTKPGVGLVVGAARPVKPATLTLTTDDPGFRAVIEAGSSSSGPFRPVSQSKVTSSTTTYALRGGGRYYLIWITDLSDHAHVNEVRAR
jgi:hypothetical protein